MKQLFFITIMVMTSLSFAQAEWKVIAETTSCADKIQILGKEGEKFVLAVQGDKRTKLYAKDDSSFKENAMRTTEYRSAANSDVSYTFIQPSMVEGNPPKVDISYHGEKKRCKMDLNR